MSWSICLVLYYTLPLFTISLFEYSLTLFVCFKPVPVVGGSKEGQFCIHVHLLNLKILIKGQKFLLVNHLVLYKIFMNKGTQNQSLLHNWSLYLPLCQWVWFCVHLVMRICIKNSSNTWISMVNMQKMYKGLLKYDQKTIG